DRARPAEGRRPPGSRPRDRRAPAGAAALLGAAARGALEGRVGRELPGSGWWVPYRPRSRADHGLGDRRRDRRADLPRVLPRTLRPHLIRGFPVLYTGGLGCRRSWCARRLL